MARLKRVTRYVKIFDKALLSLGFCQYYVNLGKIRKFYETNVHSQLNNTAYLKHPSGLFGLGGFFCQKFSPTVLATSLVVDS